MTKLTENAQRFLDAYAEEIAKAMTRDPESYCVRDTVTIPLEAHSRADRIVRALAHGDRVCASPTLRRAAKRLGLADTKQTTIMAYLQQPDEPAPGPVDVGTITEYGLTQRLSNNIRCF